MLLCIEIKLIQNPISDNKNITFNVKFQHQVLLYVHLPEAPSVFPKIIDNNSNVPITGAPEKNQNISGTSVNKSKLLSSATFNLLVRAAQIYVSIC